ncbi:hypothetical protein [Rhodococcus kronopolitis]|uniref:Secreted protein n=1 Tax=Rhodococcus kronopolitis TaxID=1460226 RepID=A0ABV9FSI3_9NOCA
MSENMMRRGASILAAVTIVVGGLTIGTGAAGAEGSSGSGSGDLLPDKIGQQMLRECDPMDAIFLIPLLIPCWDSTASASAEVGDFTIASESPKSVAPQESARFRIHVFRNSESGGDAALAVTSVTHQPPKGFKFSQAAIFDYNPDAPRPSWTATSDPTTGAVTLTAPPEGWSMGDKSIEFDFFYEAGDAQHGADGDHGAKFTGTGVPPADDWQLTGHTRVETVKSLNGGSS